MELLLLGKDAICMDLEVPHQIPEIIVNEHITKNICIYLFIKPNFIVINVFKGFQCNEDYSKT